MHRGDIVLYDRSLDGLKPSEFSGMILALEYPGLPGRINGIVLAYTRDFPMKHARLAPGKMVVVSERRLHRLWNARTRLMLPQPTNIESPHGAKPAPTVKAEGTR